MDGIAQPRLVVTGAGGRVGRLMRAAFALDPAGPEPLWLSTSGAPGAVPWDGRSLPRVEGGVLLALARPAREADAAALALAQVAAARAAGIGRVLLASSCAVYGAAEDAGEDAPLAPVTSNGEAKRAMERAAAGAGVHMLRLSNVVGADSLARPLAEGTAALDRMGGRGPVRSYLGAAALLEAARALAAAPEVPAVLNVAQAPPLAMGDLLEAAGVRIEWREGGSGPARATCDPSRLHDLAPLPPADPARLVAALRAQQAWQEGRTAGARA